MRWLVFIIVMAMSSTALAEIKNCVNNSDTPYRCGTSWDANVDIGYGPYGLARARVGLMLVRSPFFFNIGPTATIYNIAPADFGIQEELIHLSTGLWSQLGMTMNTEKRIAMNGSIGWSIFGFETQVRRERNRFVWFCFGKIRIPIGMLALIKW